MGIKLQLTSSPGCGTAPCKKIFGAPKGTRIDCFYFPEPTNQSTKIVFIQVMRELLDGAAELPSKLDPGFNYQDADTTAHRYHVDYVAGEKDPYYNGDDPQDHDLQGSAFPSLWSFGYAWMWDQPSFDSTFPNGGSKMKYEFRTAAYSAAGADAGSYYQYQDWTYEMDKGGTGKLTLGVTGFDPGQDFKDAVKLWGANHGFTIPTPPPPLPPPNYKGAMKYKVITGDSLQTVARRFYGNDMYWPLIYGANVGVIGYTPVLSAGQILIIP